MNRILVVLPRKNFLQGVLIALTIWILAVGLASYRLQPAQITAKAVSLLEAQTGTRVRVMGPYLMTYFPWFGFSTGPLTVTSSHNSDPSPILSSKTLTARIRLWSLLWGEIKLDNIILQEPVVSLVWQADGTPPWGADSSEDEAVEGANPQILQDLSIAGLLVDNGTVIIKKPDSALAINIHRISLETAAITHGKFFPFKLAGNVVDTNLPMSAMLDLEGKLLVDFNSGQSSLADVALTASVAGAGIPQGLAPLQLYGNFDFSQPQGSLLLSRLTMRTKTGRLLAAFNGHDLFDRPGFTGTIDGELLAGVTIKVNTELKAGTLGAVLTIAAQDGTRLRSDILFAPTGQGGNSLTVGGEVSGIDSKLIPGLPPVLSGRLQSRFAFDSTGGDVAELLQDIKLDVQTGLQNQPDKQLHLQAVASFDQVEENLSLKNAQLLVAQNSINFAAELIDLSSPQLMINGFIDADKIDINNFFYLLKQSPPQLGDPKLLQELSIYSDFQYSKKGFKVSKLAIKSGDMLLKANVGFVSQAVSKLDFAITANRLDLDGLLPKTPKTAASNIKPAKPQPIDFSSIKKLNWNGTVAIDELLVGGLLFEDLNIKSRSNNLNSADLQWQGTLAAGKFNGKITADTITRTPELSLRLRYREGEMGTLMTTLAGKPYVTGKIQLFADLNTAGTNKKKLLAALNGRAGATINNGMINHYKTAEKEQKPTREKSLTIPYRRFFGHFQVRDGTFHTDYLNIKGSQLTATGRGKLNLTNNQIDLSIQSLYKQLVKIPVTVKGDIANPDVKVIMQDLVIDTTDNVLAWPMTILEQLYNIAGPKQK